MVVIGIVAIITVLTLANYRGAEKRKRVQIASETVKQALRSAQTFALTGRQTNNPNANCRTPVYYMINFTYTNNFSIQAINNCGTTDLIDTFNLPSQTRFLDQGLILGNSDANDNLEIRFNLPNANITGRIDSQAIAPVSNASLVLESDDGSINYPVTVNGTTGRID